MHAKERRTYFMAIPYKERLATLHAICLQISLQSLFRIFPHASCVHIFRDISGKYSKIHKGFSPFFPSSLKKFDDASVAQSLCGIALCIVPQFSQFVNLFFCNSSFFGQCYPMEKKRTSRLALFQNRIISGIGYSTTPFCSSSARAVSTESTPTAFFTGANSLLRSTSNARQLSCMCTMSSTSVSNL